ncbi:MAG TPA: hypothetical protein VLK56_01225 [Solirubrobacterales bacterium]|nr:hypothetical protein [Solirubrobacterales bacterium]
MNLTEGARHERLQFYFVGIAVDLHPDPEGVEDRAAEFGIGARQRLAEVGETFQNSQRVLRPGDAGCGGVELAQEVLGLHPLGLEGADPLADHGGIDTRLDRCHLALGAAVDFADQADQPIAALPVLALSLRIQRVALHTEEVEPLRPEDSRGEEGVEQLGQGLLADVLPLAVADRLRGGVAVVEPVAAGVVGMALGGLPLHPQRVVAGGAVNQAAQLVEAIGRFAPRAGPRSVAPPPHLLLHELELLDGDERLMRRLGGFDPLLRVAADQRSLALLDGAEVEPVPVEPTRVGGVFEH